MSNAAQAPKKDRQQQKYEYQAYLKKTGVFDLVQESLKETAVNRPLDPIKFIAAFLQERADKYENVGLNHGNGPQADEDIQPSHVTAQDKQIEHIVKNTQAPQQDLNDSQYDAAPVNLGQPRNKEATREKKIDASKFKSARPLVHIQDQSQLDDVAKHALLQVLQEQVVISSKLVQDFLDISKQNHSDLVQRMLPGQTIIMNQDGRHYPATNAEEMEMLINETSKCGYQNIMKCELVSKSVSDVEYKLVHNSQLELVAESTHLLPISDEQSDFITKYLVTMIEEMQLLKMIAHPKYIASIQEEIVIINGEELQQYVVIHEKSDLNLDTLPEIWKYQSQPEFENYSPEKLAYYFFQALGIINYLHENNIYHGSIRPYAFEIYRDQSMKISDLQNGIKLKDDSSKNPEREIYQLRNLPQICNKDTQVKFQQNGKFSRQQLVEIDRFALIQTFEQAIEDVKLFLAKSTKSQVQSLLFMQILNDLKKETIEKVYRKWDKYFQTHTDFFFHLSDIFEKEHKVFAIPTIFNYSSEYADLIAYEQQLIDQRLHSPSLMQDDQQSEKSSAFTSAKMNQDNKQGFNQKIFIAKWMNAVSYLNNTQRAKVTQQRLQTYLNLCYEFPNFYAVKLGSRIEAMPEIMPQFKAVLAKLPQLQQELVIYAHGLCLTCHDQQILNDALAFFKSLGKNHHAQECIALIYLRLAKLNYKEDPDGKLVSAADEQNASPAKAASDPKAKPHADRTEHYINQAVKALSNVETASGQETLKQIFIFTAKYHLRKQVLTHRLKKLFEQIQMRFFYQNMKTLTDQDLMLCQADYLDLQGRDSEALAIYQQLATLYEQIFGITSNRTLNFHWRIGKIHLRQQSPDFMSYFLQIKADAKHYLNYLDLLIQYQRNEQLVEAVHQFNPPFDLVEPFVWQYLLSKYLGIEYQTDLSIEEITYQIESYLTYDPQNPDNNTQFEQHQDDNFPLMYHDFLRFVCSHELLYKAVLAHLSIDEERVKQMIVSDKQKRLELLSALLEMTRNAEEEEEQ